MSNTRFAPSPTGEDIHVGNLRIALLNYLYANTTGGDFYIRIEDTKNDRVVNGAAQKILQEVENMGLHSDHISFQSDNKDWHVDMARELVRKDIAYEKDNAVWLSMDSTAEYMDLVKGKVTLGRPIEDFVIIRSNGEPSFIWANALDDSLISDLTVIRGDDHCINTFKQIAIYHYMGMRVPQYAHIPMLVHNKKPLSKRDGASTVESVLEMGIIPEALLVYLGSLGWEGAADFKELCEKFRLQLKSSPEEYDVKKLININSRLMTIHDVFGYCAPACKYYNVIKDHIKTLKDVDGFSYLWTRPAKYNNIIFNTLEFGEDIAASIDKWALENGGRKIAYGELRKALCGQSWSLDLALVVKNIGVDEAYRRIR